MMSAIKDLYDLERYFGAGHWISRDGKIEVPLKSAEHAEIAPDVVEKYYKDDFLDMDPGLSLSDYSDFLLDKGWIVHREGNFLCNRLDNTTKDTIFLFAKKNNFSKITVETPQKVKLIEEPPEMLYEAKTFEQWVGTGYWISPNGEITDIGSEGAEEEGEMTHLDFAAKITGKDMSDESIENDLLDSGWIKQRGASFLISSNTGKLTNREKDRIWDVAQKKGLTKISVDVRIPRSGKQISILYDQKPIELYEVRKILSEDSDEYSVRWPDEAVGFFIDTSGVVHNLGHKNHYEFAMTHYNVNDKHLSSGMDKSNFWEQYYLKLLNDGWIAQRGFCSYLISSKNVRNKTKDIIFMRAKELGCSRITVDIMDSERGWGATAKQLVDNEPPEMLYEQRNYERFFALIDPNGKVHKCNSGQIHDSWAHDYLLKNHRLMWNVLKSDNVDDSRVFTEYLLERGWVRQSNCSFETNSMRKSVCWNIYEAAKNIGCNSVFIDYHGSIIEAPIEKFIEENGQ